jgi:hypothetical protein
MKKILAVLFVLSVVLGCASNETVEVVPSDDPQISQDLPKSESQKEAPEPQTSNEAARPVPIEETENAPLFFDTEPFLSLTVTNLNSGETIPLPNLTLEMLSMWFQTEPGLNDGYFVFELAGDVNPPFFATRSNYIEYRNLGWLSFSHPSFPDGISTSMTTEQVRSFLGEPDSIVDRGLIYWYYDKIGTNFYLAFEPAGNLFDIRF